MKLRFLGAATTVTGSQFLLTTDRARVLVECGMFQGSPSDVERNRVPLAYDAATIDAILISHAHLDHSGYVPVVVREGFEGPIVLTSATADLAGLILLDSAKIQLVAVAALVVNQGTGSLGASHVAAASLREVFCAEGRDCRASRAEPLHARALARDTVARAERAAAAAEAAAIVAAEEAARKRREAELARMHTVDELDEVPRPLGTGEIDFPPWLMKRSVRGKIVLWVEIDTEGGVRDVEVESSNLALFDEIVVDQVRGWKFTTPTREGRPVNARATLPLRIRIR